MAGLKMVKKPNDSKVYKLNVLVAENQLDDGPMWPCIKNLEAKNV